MTLLINEAMIGARLGGVRVTVTVEEASDGSSRYMEKGNVAHAKGQMSSVNISLPLFPSSALLISDSCRTDPPNFEAGIVHYSL